MRCPHKDHSNFEFDDLPTFVYHVLEHLVAVEAQMTSNQQHLDTDITALTQAFGSLEAVIDGLKSQPGAEALDFTAADALVSSVSAVVTADQPPAVPSDPQGDVTAPTGDTPIGDGVPVDAPVDVPNTDGTADPNAA